MPSFVMRAALGHDNNAVSFVNGYKFVKQTITNLESLRIQLCYLMQRQKRLEVLLKRSSALKILIYVCTNKHT
jgi:hypothetical protein